MLWLSTSTATSADDPLAAQRSEFQHAWSQVASASTSSTQDSESLRRYVLYPYLRAARLGQALRAAGSTVPQALDEEIAAFLRAHDEPVVRELRQAWLTSLAARARWQDFLAAHKEQSDGAALRCHGYTARIELGPDAGLAAAVAQTWLTPRSLMECDRAFSWLSDQGGLTPVLIEQRVRLALEAGNSSFARQIAARLPPEQAAPLLQWAALLENPQREIDALIAAPQRVVDTGALLAGWTKYARAARTGAKQRFDSLVRARRLDRRAASPFALALALPLSWDRDADALRYFERVEQADFDDAAREWLTRAALWAGDWKQASGSIAAMSESSRGSARWLYWAARAAEKQGDEGTARRLYESILTEDNYYSAMAAARLKRTIAPNPQAVPQDAQLLATIGDMPAFVRSRELQRLAMLDKARVEWGAGHGQLQPPARRQAIHLAAGWGWYDQAVTVATGERIFNDYALLYPKPFDKEVASAARITGLSSHVIYGVIRQESLYQSDAVSSAGARGLMQLTLDTARRTARSWNRPAPTATSLFDPAVNVVLGSAHLKNLLERFKDQLPIALAGYNAGPGAAQRWLPAEEMDPDIWVENIPYNETRSYVQRILWHTVVFSWLEDQQQQDTREWLKALRPS
jgi:soluble lytic murein transglycosylase